MKHLERELGRVHRDLIAQAGAVEAAIHTTTRALRERDADLARRVIEGEDQIDREENRIEEECLKVLALYQPVAVDLRRVVAALKINTDLERMADLAEAIAGRALHLARLPEVPVPDDLGRMAALTSRMVRLGLDSFVNLDAELARDVCRQDDEVDRYNREIIAELVEWMRTTPGATEAGLSLFSATRHLERIADHATNIAEDAIYIVEGTIVRHRQASVADELTRARR